MTHTPGDRTPATNTLYVYASTKLGELPYALGQVGDHPAKMLIDTGAAVTLVHKRLIPPTTPILPTKRRVTGVTGSTLDLVGEAYLKLKINGLETSHNCLWTMMSS